MDKLETMRVFVAVAEEEGFAPAARRLRMSPPAVTRAIFALEDRVGARLLVRTTRVVRLTEEGIRFLADCKRIIAEVEEAEASLSGAHAALGGGLSVTASMMFGRMHVAPILLEFLALHPRVTSRALLVDRVVDLVEEGIDVAIRIAHLPDSGMKAVRVGAVRAVVCASPDYLAKRGTPQSLRDLRDHDRLAFAASSGRDAWVFGRESVDTPARLVVNDAEVAIAAAAAGHGLTRVLSYQVAPEIASGKLRIVLANLEPPPIPIHVVQPGARRAPLRVGAFVEFAAARLKADPALVVGSR